MLNENSQRTLSHLFMRVIDGENKVEILRKCLCENYDFSPKVLFRSLCKVYNDSLLPKDLKEFMRQNGEEVNDQETYLLVRQYSSLQNGRLSEEDFKHFVLSATNDTLPHLVSQRYHIYELKIGVKYSFLSLLKEELRLHRETEALKVQLFQDPEFSLWKAFEHLNSSNKGYVSESDISGFLQKRGKFVSQNDYDSLMRRIDLEDDLVISYNEFLEALIPLQVPKSSGSRGLKGTGTEEWSFGGADRRSNTESGRNLNEKREIREGNDRRNIREGQERDLSQRRDIREGQERDLSQRREAREAIEKDADEKRENKEQQELEKNSDREKTEKKIDSKKRDSEDRPFRTEDLENSGCSEEVPDNRSFHNELEEGENNGESSGQDEDRRDSHENLGSCGDQGAERQDEDLEESEENLGGSGFDQFGGDEFEGENKGIEDQISDEEEDQ